MSTTPAHLTDANLENLLQFAYRKNLPRTVKEAKKLLKLDPADRRQAWEDARQPQEPLPIRCGD